jgi:signal peptidase I
VQCCDAEGRVTVDGEALDEPYILENTPIESRAFGPVTVEEGRLWVMGDHRSLGRLQGAHGRPVLGHDRCRRRHRQGGDDRLAARDRFGLLDSPDIQGTEAAAATVAPYAVGLAGAVPLVAWRRARARDDD